MNMMRPFLFTRLRKMRIPIRRVYSNSLQCFSNQAATFDHLSLIFHASPKIIRLNRSYVRHLYISTPKMFKYFKESENNTAHESMINNLSYSESVVQHPKILVELNDDIKLGSAFKTFHDLTVSNFSNPMDLGHEDCSQISHELTQSFPTASYEELIHTMYCMCFWPFPSKSYDLNFKRIWNALDYECVKRIHKWSVSQKLLVADYWFHLRLNRITLYNLAMIKNLIHQRDNLTIPHIVQLMFFINLQRTVPQSLLSMVESKIESAVKTVTMEELNIICLGYFKTESVILNQNVLKAIMDRVSKNMEGLESLHINGIIKCLRKSFQNHLIGYYGVFLKTCAIHAHKWSLQASIHAALLCSATNVFEPFLLDNAVDKLENEVQSSRLKDMCKLVQSLSVFNYLPDKNFNDTLLNELFKKEREEEILYYPHDAVQMVLFFAYMGYYRNDVLKFIMNPLIMEKVQKIDKTAFAVLDYCIDIECRDYDGPRLEKGLKHYIVTSKREINTNNFQSIVKKVTESLLKTTKKIFGEENACVKHVLPHLSNADLILRLHSGNRNKLPLSDIVKTCPDYEIFIPPADETLMCFVICNPFSFAHGTTRPSGVNVFKQRQLRLLGYEVAAINHRQVPFDDLQREMFITNIVNSVKNRMTQRRNVPHLMKQ